MKIMESTLADDAFISVENMIPAGSFPAYHSHNVLEIYILNSGSRQIFIGTTLYSTAPGDAALIMPHIPHRSFGKVSYSGICIEISQRFWQKPCRSQIWRVSVPLIRIHHRLGRICRSITKR